MAGQKGMIRARPVENCVRAKAWVTIRKYYAGGFTLRDLLVTIAEAKESNLDRWMRHMRIHGYFEIIGNEGRVVRGSQTRYRLVRDESVSHPILCSRCGQPIARVTRCVVSPVG